MTAQASIELHDLELDIRIGTPGPGEAPHRHWLDLTLTIDPAQVLIATDGMAHVFDYDPLVAEVQRLAHDGPYETQERLITRIAQACAAHAAIEGVAIVLRKGPVAGGTGSLGVRLVLDRAGLAGLQGRPAPSRVG